MEASSCHRYLQEVTLLHLLLNFKRVVVKIPPRSACAWLAPMWQCFLPRSRGCCADDLAQTLKHSECMSAEWVLS